MSRAILITSAMLVFGGVAFCAEPFGPVGKSETFHDGAGRVTGSSRTDGNGVTRFYDGAGRVTGSARTDGNGVRSFYDSAGRVIGKARVGG